jgi:hypothetical protein
VITVTVKSKNQAADGFKAVERDAGQMSDRVAAASLQVAQANLRVERATKSLEAAQSKYGRESLQAREKTVSLQRAQLGASRASKSLERAQNDLAEGVQHTGREMTVTDAKTDKLGGGMDALKGKAAKVTAAFAAAAATVGGLGAGIEKAMDAFDAGAVLEAQLGHLPAGAVVEAGRAAGRLYSQAWGESLRDVNDAVRRVMLDVGVTSTDQMEAVTRQVMAMSETFGLEVTELTRGAGQLVRTGLADSASEAMDIIAQGLRLGVDKVGDYMDTLEEYGTQWRKFGLTGAQATGLLVQGLQAGARNADVVADAIKEFAIRAVDGTDKTIHGFESLGLNARKMADDIAAGGDRSAKALDLTLDRLRAMEDPVERDRVAVELFGTKAEDLGDALYALDPSSAIQAMGDFAGAAGDVTEKVGDTPRRTIEEFKRALSAGFTNALAKGLNLLQDAWVGLQPYLQIAGDIIMPTLKSISDELAETWGELVDAGLDKYLKMLAGVLGGMVMVNLVGTLKVVEFVVHAFGKFVSVGLAVRARLLSVAQSFGLTSARASRFARAIASAMATAIRWVGRLISRVRGLPGAVGRAVSGVYGRFTAPFRNAVRAISSWLSGLSRRISSIRSAASRLSPLSWFGFAHGGVIGADSGGPRSGWTMVGEHGRELVQLSPGSRVMSNPDTERALADSRGAGPVTVQVEWVGGDGGDEFLAWLRKNIRIRGGVTSALGA